MSNRVLVIGAHCDDESFGCLGTLLKHKKAGDRLGFIAFTEARHTVWGWKQATEYFDREYEHFVHLIDQRLDTFAIQDITKHIEDGIALFKPDIVYTNFIGDLNKDHRLVAEATMVGCRPYKEWAPKEVWMYSLPGSTELGFRPMKVDKHVKIDKDRKERLIKDFYPNELINGREKVGRYETFEKWPA